MCESCGLPWRVIQSREGPWFHIVPTNDIIEHVQSPNCECGPEMIPMWSGMWVEALEFAHIAMDGRE